MDHIGGSPEGAWKPCVYIFYRKCPGCTKRPGGNQEIRAILLWAVYRGKDSPHFGRSHVHWLTGTASTVMVGCVEGILGIRPDFYGLKIEPSIPAEWERFEMQKDFRGKHLNIVVKNPGHKESGFKRLMLDGKEIEGNYILAELLGEESEIVLEMS